MDVRRASFAPRPTLASRVPAVAAAVAGLIAVVNLASALTPELPGRLRALLALAPVHEVTLAHVVAIPVGLALAVSAWPLARGSRVAWRAATLLLLAGCALNLLKGLDVEEAAVSLAGAAGLWRGRAAFTAVPEPSGLARAMALTLAAAGGALAIALLVIAAYGGGGMHPLAAAKLLAGVGPVLVVPHDMRWLADGLWALGLGVGAIGLACCLAPARRALLTSGDDADRNSAAALLRRHGTGTLGAFTLRRDLARVWSPCGEAYLAYRVEAGTLLLAGDPVGDRRAHGAALDAAIALARRHGLVIGGVAAGDAFAETARGRGLRRMYLGDEAMLRTGELDLSGGRFKSLRKAVNRIERNGYVAELHAVGALDAATLARLEEVSELWRDGADERGFALGHDELVDELLPDASVVLARDADGVIRGFLHFVPVVGRPQASLAFMRRDRETPNGLSDFLVIRAAALLAEQGVEELSLNFATFAALRRAPRHAGERLLVRVLLTLDAYFHLGGLEHFNAKFDPGWQPRNMLFPSAAGFPRVMLATMWAEGVLAKPELPRVASRRR